eukprot:2673393-Pyramimonas_sp.AAC.1
MYTGLGGGVAAGGDAPGGGPHGGGGCGLRRVPGDEPYRGPRLVVHRGVGADGAAAGRVDGAQRRQRERVLLQWHDGREHVRASAGRAVPLLLPPDQGKAAATLRTNNLPHKRYLLGKVKGSSSDPKRSSHTPPA